MPKATPLPVHLAELLDMLDGQLLEDPIRPDRMRAVMELEKKHGVQINFSEANEHPEFSERYKRWLDRIDVALEDQSLRSAFKGGASATTIARGRGLLGGGGRRGDSGGRGNGRLTLDRDHRSAVEGHRRGW